MKGRQGILGIGEYGGLREEKDENRKYKGNRVCRQREG